MEVSPLSIFLPASATKRVHYLEGTFIKGLENATRKEARTMQNNHEDSSLFTLFITPSTRAFNHPGAHRTEKLSIAPKSFLRDHNHPIIETGDDSYRKRGDADLLLPITARKKNPQKTPRFNQKKHTPEQGGSPRRIFHDPPPQLRRQQTPKTAPNRKTKPKTEKRDGGGGGNRKARSHAHPQAIYP